MRLSLSSRLLAATLLLPLAARAENWPQWRGPEFSGVSHETNLPVEWGKDKNVAWRLAICGLGLGFFQTPNNRLLIGSAPPNRAGAGSGILSTSRLLGQTTGSALVAVVFGLTHGADGVAYGTHVTIGMAAGFSALAMVLSTLRIAQARGV